MSLIALAGVSKRYGDHPAVQDVSLAIEEGERVVMWGPSGCGKTTVLRLLAGFLAPDTGSISIDGAVVATDGKILQPPEKRHLGMVFQDLALWPHMTVTGNLDFGLSAQGVPREERRRRTREILDLVEMQRFADARPGALSGGQQQRVALARALVLRPRALLMDEPLSNLDQDLNVRLRREILRLHRALGFTLVYVTHDREEAAEIGTRLVRMRQGRIEPMPEDGGPRHPIS